jgi:hypothetical protein
MDQHYQLISFFKSILSSQDADIVNNIETALKREEKDRQELHFLRHSELQYIVYNMNMLKDQDKLHETLLNLEKLYYSSGTRKSNTELKSEVLNTHSVRKDELREMLERSDESKSIVESSTAAALNEVTETLDEFTDGMKHISINNVVYCSLKDACDKTKVNKSTILWRLKSKNFKFKDYKYVNVNSDNLLAPEA